MQWQVARGYHSEYEAADGGGEDLPSRCLHRTLHGMGWNGTGSTGGAAGEVQTVQWRCSTAVATRRLVGGRTTRRLVTRCRKCALGLEECASQKSPAAHYRDARASNAAVARWQLAAGSVRSRVVGSGLAPSLSSRASLPRRCWATGFFSSSRPLYCLVQRPATASILSSLSPEPRPSQRPAYRG